MTDRDGTPDPLVIATVVDISRELRLTGTVAAWSTANMFIPDTSQRAALNKLDLAILTELDILADVCLRPHDRLDRIEEVVRADLARRIPPAGLTRLAAHPEDMAGVEHGRVRPRRVVTSRYVEAVDFYENRVAAQLVDRLGEHLTRRIRELAVLADGLADLDEFDQALRLKQSWRRLDRVARLMAQAVEDTTASIGAIDDSLRRLRRARARLRALHDTPVLRRANRRTRVPMRLMQTNLFTNDRRYRRIGVLWELWAVYEAATLERIQAGDREFGGAYNGYVAALSLRAMAILGYTLADPEAPLPQPGSTVELRGPAGELTWRIDRSGTIGVIDQSTELTSVVPFQHDLGVAVPEQVRLERFDRIAAMPGSVIVVYPGLRVARAMLPAPLRLRAHPAGFGASPCIVPVTPLEIECEERLARALRWTLQGLRFATEYPPEIQLRAPVPDISTDWLRPVSRQRAAVVRRPNSEERSELINVLASMDRVVRRTGTDSHADEIEDLDRATDRFRIFETCPLCHGRRTELSPWNSGTFQCRCVNCDATWGTRMCGRCKRPYPVLSPHNPVIDTTDGDRLDTTAGADVLALPCEDEKAVPGARFRCSWCGHCAGQPHCGCPPSTAPHQS